MSTHVQIHARFDSIRQFRNRVAHREPVRDRDYLRQHDRIVESIAWMNPTVAEAVRVTSPAPRAYTAGADELRPYAESLVGTGRGFEAMLAIRAAAMSAEHRALLDGLAEVLSAAEPGRSARDIATAGVRSLA